MADKDTLLMQITQDSFAINDLTLYLDTHPDDEDALELFGSLQEKRSDALQEFAESYYPLTVDSITETGEWTWGSAPAPWEVEANVEL